MNLIKTTSGKTGLFLLAVLVSLSLSKGFPNTEIFHEHPDAKKFVTFDKESFIIMGMRTFLTAGSIHYTRVPRELWRDRLARAKMAGFNTITTYVSWNAHEPEEGQFDFSDNKDLSGFLDACREARLYAIVRLGPYSCAEWDLGGFPAWLAVGKGVRLRTDDPEYLKYVDAWFEKLLPTVARHQIHKGGAVIMVQLENEYKGGWGTDEDPYLAHLRKKVIELGVEVPMFYSGLRPGPDPAGEQPTKSAGESPWFSTEFRSGGYDLFGELPESDIDRYERAVWKIMAQGGAGYNCYMLHGGTNWGYTSNDEISTSYDFGAPIGESGALRKSYFRFKEAAIFAATFGQILIRGTSDEKDFKVNSGELTHYLRRTPRGNILFLDNPGKEAITTRFDVENHPALPLVKPLTLRPGEIRPILIDLPLGAGVTISHCTSRVLTIRRLQDRTFIFVHGRKDEPGEIAFQLKGALRLISGIRDYIMDATGRTLIASFTFPGEWEKKDYAFTSGVATIQVVALGEKLAERAWFDPWGMGSCFLIGPSYVHQLSQEGESVKIAAEFRGNEEACYVYTRKPLRLDAGKSTDLIAFEADDANRCLNGKVLGLKALPEAPQVSGWRQASASPEAGLKFDDSGWSLSEDPKDMGASPGAHRAFYGWYRCSFASPVEGKGELELPFAGDTIYVYINGTPVEKSEKRGGQSVSVPLQKGENVVAVLARHSGRDKLYNFSGVAGLKVATGIHGRVKLTVGTESRVLKGWRYRAGLIGEEEKWFLPEAESSDRWRPLNEKAEASGPMFYTATFPYKGDPGFSEVFRLKTKELSHGTLWLNGKILGQYMADGEYYLPEPWLKAKNLIVIADEEGKSPSGVMLVREDAAAGNLLNFEFKPE